MKPNHELLYIITLSNHPPPIIKQLPASISFRISYNSANEEIFNKSKNIYKVALKSSGYKNVNLQFTNPSQRKKNTVDYKAKNIMVQSTLQ